MVVMDLCDTTSSSVTGRYFSTLHERREGVCERRGQSVAGDGSDGRAHQGRFSFSAAGTGAAFSLPFPFRGAKKEFVGGGLGASATTGAGEASWGASSAGGGRQV